MPQPNTQELHARATDLLIKTLKMDADSRIAFVNELLTAANLTDAELKRLHELIRKACEARDKLAISLHTINWADPRQFEMFGDDISPGDFE